MRKIIYSIFIMASIISCTDLDDVIYDKIPADQYPENDKQLAGITTPIYLPMQDFLDDGGGWWYAQEVTSDEMTVPTREGDWGDGGKWVELHTHTWTNFNGEYNRMWEKCYMGIVEANKLLDRVATWEQNEEVAKLVAKVKIMRAYYYYLLIDNYGDVPYFTSFVNAPVQPNKDSRAAVFDSIVYEIEKEVLILSSNVTKTGVSKGMAYSLLAKLYLNAEIYTGSPRWVEAEEACDSVISIGLYNLESDVVGAFKTDNENSNENIFVIPYDEDTYGGFLLHLRTLHYEMQKTYDMPVGTWNGFCAMEDHYNTYTDDDRRKSAYFLVGQQYSSTGEPLFDNTANAPVILVPEIKYLVMVNMAAWFQSSWIRLSGARVQKFEIKMGAKFNLSNDFPIFRYGDILLMKAEAMIRQGANGDEYVNMIRRRAGFEVDWTNTGLDDLLAERGREMFWEAHRRQDLIRFGKFGDAWWEKEASGSDRTVFPIPDWAIEANPNLAK